jgi:DNA-binding transcriptional LysR family regulator
MELRHIRYFLALSNTLNFTVAAKRLNISQPPLSQQIADLERELSVKLFDRHSRSVALTAAGHVFRRHAEAMLAQVQQAAAEVQAIDRGTTGILNVAATSSVLFSGLSAAIAAFKAVNPSTEIVIHELSPGEQIERLELHRVDACFLRFAPEERNFQVTRVWSERVGLIVPQAHRLAARKWVRISSLKNEDFVFFRLPDSAFAAHLQAICIAEGFAPRIVQQVVEAFSVVSLVSAGLGIGFVPEPVGHMNGAHVKYLDILGPCPAADVRALTRHDATPLARRFVAFTVR